MQQKTICSLPPIRSSASLPTESFAKMKENYNTRIIGEKVILIPFRKEHCPVYLKWMQDPNLIELTASEHLDMQTLEKAESHQMMVHEDDSNCTFLIMERVANSETGVLVGDINLFIQSAETTSDNELDDLVNSESNNYTDSQQKKQIELNIMIAEQSARRKGLAFEALLLAISYGISVLKTSSFIAKISDDNIASISMFRDKLKWPMVNHSNVFQESTFATEVDSELLEFIAKSLNYMSIQEDYDDHMVKSDTIMLK